MELIEDLKSAIIEGEEEKSIQKAEEILSKNINVREAISEGLVSGMKHVGRLYEEHVQNFLKDEYHY